MKQHLSVIVLACFVILAVLPIVNADIITNQGNGSFILTKLQGETFIVQDLAHNLNINFTVNSGSIYSLSTLTLNSTGGAFTFYSSTSATLVLNTNGYAAPLQLLVNGVAYSGLVAIPVHVVIVVSWVYTSPLTPSVTPTPSPTPNPSATPTATPTAPPTSPTPTVNPTITVTPTPTTNPLFPTSISTSAMWQYLFNWDFAGFIIATWTYSLGQSFFVIVAFIVSLAIYIRYQNLVAIGIIWIVVGSVFVVWIPMVTPFIIFAYAFGFGSLVYKVYEARN